MTPVELIRAARAAGIHLEARGERLHLSGRAAAPATLVDALRRQKAGVLAVLAVEAGEQPKPLQPQPMAPGDDAPCGRRQAVNPAAQTRSVDLDAEGLPFAPCPSCGGQDFYKDAGLPLEGDGWCCATCAPPPPDLWRHAVSVPAPTMKEQPR